MLPRGSRLFVTEDREGWTTVRFESDEFVDVAVGSGGSVYRRAPDG